MGLFMVFYDPLDIFIFGSNWELLQSWNVTLCMYVCIDFQENQSNIFLLNNIFYYHYLNIHTQKKH